MEDTGSDSGDFDTTADCSPPQTMLEVLGEHLYAKVGELQETLGVTLDIPKLTGILLELGEQQVLKLLQDEKLLRQGVDRVMQHVPAVCRPQEKEEAGEADTELQDQLFSQVCLLEPELATHITGMLLELSFTQVKSLLGSGDQLTQAVRHAKAAYLAHQASRQKNSPQAPCEALSGSVERWQGSAAEGRKMGVGSPQERWRHHGDGGGGGGAAVNAELEELGEKLYAEAERLYPDCADKLTGMVLDMGKEQATALLQDGSQLQKVLRVAFSSLSPSEKPS